MPDTDIIEVAREGADRAAAHPRRRSTKRRDEIANKAAAHKLPRDLPGRVRTLLAECPELPWDMALAAILHTP